MSELEYNLIRSSWDTKKEIREDIEAAGFDILNETEFKIDVIDRAESDGVVETFEFGQEDYWKKRVWVITRIE